MGGISASGIEASGMEGMEATSAAEARPGSWMMMNDFT